MKKIYLKPQIRIVLMYPHTIMTGSEVTNDYMGNDPLGPNDPTDQESGPSRWFNDEMWDDKE